MKAKIYSDGGARGNPGIAAGGYLIFSESDKLIDFGGKYFGITTNNQAEYQAILLALQAARRHNISNAKCYLDSELAVKQINGTYKVKNKNMKKWKDEIDKICKNFRTISFNHVEREQNKFADKLLNLILNTIEKSPT